MANLSVNLCGVTLKNPVVAASGTFGFGREYNELYDIGRLGGVSTKGLTLEPRLGNPTPRIAESRGVILNAVGLQNPGVEHFIAHDLEWLKGTGTAVIANVAGKTLEEYAEICARLDGLADMIELNISCPNVRCGGMAFGIRPESVREVTRVSKAALKKTPLMVKPPPRGRRKRAARTRFPSSIPLRAWRSISNAAVPCWPTIRAVYRARGLSRLRCAWCSRRRMR